MRSSSGGDRRSDRQEDTNLLILSNLDTLSADMFQLRGKVDEYTKKQDEADTLRAVEDARVLYQDAKARKLDENIHRPNTS